MKIRIILADDHIVMREGLCALLNTYSDMLIVGEADNGRDAVSLARKHTPDVVVMDISMPDMNGADATCQIVAENKFSKVVALSMYSDKRFVDKMLRAGAMGYLLKNCATKELVFAIRCVVKGQTYLSPNIAGTVVKEYIKNGISPSVVNSDAPLTLREREIVQLIAEGGGTKGIADKLCLSPKTIETHRRRIMEKLQYDSIAQLVKYAIREGLTELNPI